MVWACFGSMNRRYIKRGRKGWRKRALTTLPEVEQIVCFLHHYARVAASPFPILSGDQ
jgi:hypothetical protein